MRELELRNVCEQRACACLSAAGEYRRRVFGVGKNTVTDTACVRNVKDAHISQHWELWEPRREVWSSMSSSVTVTKYGEMGEVNGILPSATPFLTRTPHRHSEPASGSSKYKQPKETNNMNLVKRTLLFHPNFCFPRPHP